MQQSVVPELALAQTATRPIHWVATATAVAAVVAASSFVQTDDATAQPDAHARHTHSKTTPHPAVLAAPNPHSVSYPVQCGPAKVLVQKSVTGDIDGDGRAETISLVHCDAGSGTPPSGVYVVTAPANGYSEPRIVATLVDPKDRFTVTDLAVRNATITATLLGYSSPDVPSCCPDEQQKAQWQWHSGAFVRSTPTATHPA